MAASMSRPQSDRAFVEDSRPISPKICSKFDSGTVDTPTGYVEENTTTIIGKAVRENPCVQRVRAQPELSSASSSGVLNATARSRRSS
ncbi:hypothetical protein Trydic_g9721 [Trypoxylus dichotomus]